MSTTSASLGAAGTAASSSGATAASSTGTTAVTPSKCIHWSSMCTIQRYIRNAVKMLGRIGAGAILLFALAHFVPELREEMPSFYRLVDFIIDAIEWIYTKFWAILT